MILGQEPITLRRYNAALTTWGTDGRVTPPTTTDTTIQASVQPAAGRDLEALEEGKRSLHSVRVYTTTALRVADARDQTLGDRLVIDGEVFEVAVVMRQRSIIPHFKVIAVELRE